MSNFFVLSFIDYSKKATYIEGVTYNVNSEKIKKIFKNGESIKEQIHPPFTCIINENLKYFMYYFLKASPKNNDEFNIIFSGQLYDQDGNSFGEIFDEGESLLSLFENKELTIIIDEKETIFGNKVDTCFGYINDVGDPLILSEKACDLFKQFEADNLEFFDVVIKSKKEVIKGYKFLNIVGDKIDCIDTEKSEIEYYDDGDVEYVNKLVFDESKIPRGKNIFLLAKHETAKLFVHESIKKIIEENLIGFDFIHVDDYQVD